MNLPEGTSTIMGIGFSIHDLFGQLIWVETGMNYIPLLILVGLTNTGNSRSGRRGPPWSRSSHTAESDACVETTRLAMALSSATGGRQACVWNLEVPAER